MTYWIGKIMEIVALVAVALGLVIGLETDNIRLELTILAAGAVLFIAGRALEKKGAGE